MKLIHSRAATSLLALSVSLLLMACGSGSSLPAVALFPGTDVPLSATQTSQAAFDFVTTVVAKGEADTETPLVVGDAELAVSDITDPMFVAA